MKLSSLSAILMAFTFASATLTSCNDDHNLPDVDVTVSIEGAAVADGNLYVVKGNTLKVVSVNLENNTGKDATIGSAAFYWDMHPVGKVMTPPFTVSVDTSRSSLGSHTLHADVTIYAVGYSPCMAQLATRIIVVDSASDIPGGAGTAPTTMSTSLILR